MACLCRVSHTAASARKDRAGRCSRTLAARVRLPQLRVRVHADKLVRLEIPLDDVPAFLAHRDRFVTLCKKLGFLYVSLDLSGLKSGSMNAVLMHEPVAPAAR